MICGFFQVLFLKEIFDLRGKEMKYAKELLLNHHRKSVKNYMRLRFRTCGQGQMYHWPNPANTRGLVFEYQSIP